LRIKSNGAQIFEPVSRFDQAAGGFVPVEIDMGTAAGDIVYVLFYGTGLRKRTSAGNISINLAGTIRALNPGNFEDAVAVDGFVGLDQANVLLPANLAGRGLINISFTIDGKPSNTIQLRIK
jgi:uncharacterized protein (TIGR03437 family)